MIYGICIMYVLYDLKRFFLDYTNYINVIFDARLKD